MVRLGCTHVIGLWLEAQQRMVITVHEDDAGLPVTSTAFARLAARMPHFKITHDDEDEIRYEFAWAS